MRINYDPTARDAMYKRRRYPWEQLRNIGDYFDLDKADAKGLRQAASMYGAMHGVRIYCFTIEGGKYRAMLSEILDPAYKTEENWIDRAAAVARQLRSSMLAGVLPEAGTGKSLTHLAYMADVLMNKTLDSETKACRWLGWLQCGIVFHGLSTLEAEKTRNFRSHNGRARSQAGKEEAR